jgi:signal transduction histidine kinase
MSVAKIRKSFKTRVTLSILGVGLVVVLLGLSAVYGVARNHLQNTIGAQYRQLAADTGDKIWSLIETDIKELSLLSLSSDVRTSVELANAAYSRRRMSESDIQKRIQNLKALWSRSKGVKDPLVREFLQNPGSDYIKGSLRDPNDRAKHLSILITDQRGILVSADAKPANVFYGDETWWKAAFSNGHGSVYISDVQTTQEATEEFEKLYTLSIAVPVMESTGTRAIGVIKTDLQIKRFFEAVTKVHIAKTDHTMLASSDGTLIFCPIFLIRNHTLRPELMKAVFKDDPGWAITADDVHYGGQQSINGFAPVNITRNIHPASFGGKRWYIFTSQNPVETYASVTTLLNWILFLGALGILLLLFLGLYAANHIVRPVQELQKGVKLIGYGNLNHRLQIHTGDEIQELADEFNEMAIKLQASYSGLEQKVAERTRELAVVNKITQIISSKLNIAQIFESFCDEVIKLLPYDRISIALLDENRRQISLRLIKTMDSPTVTHDLPRPKAGTAIGWVVDHQQPCLRTDVLQGGEFIEDRMVASEGMRSYIVVPIVSQNKAIGTLNLVSRRPQTYSERNLEILIPIAEQVAIAVETVRLFEQTKKLDLLKSDFVSKVSHELRTPLTSIKGFTEILLSYQDVDLKTQKEFISIIHEESERLTRLINDILDLSKIESGKTDWQIQSLSAFEIATRAAKSLRAMALEKNLRIAIEIPETLPKMRGDADRLIQVLDNLLSNAIKFSDHGKITLQAQLEDSRIRLSVIDEGIGIPDSDIEKIFDKFYQLGDTRSGKPRGTGLGLAICREIVQYMGGKIWCESEPGKGSRFHFTLPVWSENLRYAETKPPLESGGERSPKEVKRAVDS